MSTRQNSREDPATAKVIDSPDGQTGDAMQPLSASEAGIDLGETAASAEPNGGPGNQASIDDAGGSEGAKTARVVACIRDMILTDELPPGSPVRERKLAEALKVSRTPMREALKTLAAEGLIELHRHRGAYVAAPGEDEIFEILELLSVTEGFAAELAARRITAQELLELRALHHEMVAAFLRGDRLGYFHRNQDIHIGVVTAARNSELIRQYRVLNARVYRIRFKCNLLTEQWRGAINEHENLLAALERRDGAEAAQIQRRHVFGAWERMQAVLSTDVAS